VPEPLLADFYDWAMRDTSNAAGITIAEWQRLPKPMRRRLRRRWNADQRWVWCRDLEPWSIAYILCQKAWGCNVVFGTPLVLALFLWIAVVWFNPDFVDAVIRFLTLGMICSFLVGCLLFFVLSIFGRTYGDWP
jgi:hypothetical protein